MFKFSFAQVVTVTGGSNTTPSLSSSYTSLANAITALNSITAISGPVVITLNPGNSEVAPAGGYEINFSATTSESNNVVIDGSSSYNTISSSPSLTSGSITDAVFKLIGCDFVTIKRFTIIENSSNTTTTLGTNNMTEWGIALLRASTSDGAQANTIEDNNISLSRSYQNSFGIYSNVRHSATTPGTSSDIVNGTTAPNHSNKIYNNRISDVSMGIAFIGSSTDSRMDIGNDIGGNSSSTGNEITSWGGNALADASFTGNLSEYYGALIRSQKDVNISWNEIIGSTSLSGSSAAQISGIRYRNTTGTVTGSFSTSILNNTIAITDNLPNGSSSLSRVDGIFISDNLATGSLYINNNIISGLAVTTSNSNRQIRGITNTASASNVYINNNTIKGNTSTATSQGGWFFGIDQTGTVSDILEINDNLIGESSSTTPAISYSATAHASTIVRGISNNQSSNASGTLSVSINDNSLYGFVQANSPTNNHIYIYCDHTTTIASEIEINGNQFINLSANVSGDVTFISSPGEMSTSAGAELTVSNNEIVGTFTKTISGGEVFLYRADGNSSTGNSMIESGNDFSNITLTGTTIMRGWYNTEGASAAGPEKSITNNVFENWTCGSSGSTTVNAIYCDWASGNSQISGNRISNITAPQDVFGIHSASSTATVLTMNSNSIDGLTTLSASGEMVGAEISALGILSSFHNNVVTNAPIVGGAAIGFRFPVATASTIIDYSYNSIRLNASSSTATFNSAAIFVTANATTTSGQAFIRNNILVNLSTPGSSGRSSAIVRSGATFANLDPSSDNNVLYVTPGTNRFILYNGTGYATIAAYKAVLPGGYTDTESNSLQQLPTFVSATDLHLQPFPANYLILNGGLNNGAALGVDVVGFDMDSDPRMITAPFITDIGADQVSPLYTINVWTGAAGGGDDNWSTPDNWSLGVPPDDASTNAYIPYVFPNPQPYIDLISTWQVANVYFETGVGGIPLLTNNGLLQVAENIFGDAGSFDNYDRTSPSEITGSVTLNGSTGTQMIGGSIFVNNRVFNFTTANNVTISALPSDGVKIVGELGFGAASGVTLNTGPSSTGNNQNITLISTSTGTANVAPITNSNVITGDVTVERYIHTGTAAASGPIPAQHARSWQFLSTPTSGQSVRQSWMEGMITPGDDINPGYGANIAGGSITTPVTGNYDQVYIGNPGLRWWDHTFPLSGNFIDIPDTDDPLYNPRGYFLFVRGDRSVFNFSGPNSTPVPTILRQKGTLFQPSNPPDQTNFPSGTSTTLPISVGNPYASAINLNDMISLGGFTNISSNVYIYDPTLGSLGGYQLLDASNGFELYTPTTTTFYTQFNQYPNIQSGNAFYVSPASNLSAGNITFTESVKSNSNLLVNRSTASVDSIRMDATLYLPGDHTADGNAVIFSNNYSNQTDSNDIIKLQNFGENFFIIQEDGLYIVAKRDLIGTSDSIFYSFSNLATQTYKLKLAPYNLDEVGLTALLIDNYLDTTFDISLDDDTEISFVVDSNSNSIENRFTLVFTRSEESKQPIEAEKLFVTVFPNPVMNKTVFLQFNEELSGNWMVQIVNTSGQGILNQELKRITKGQTVSLNLNNTIPSGIYRLIISNHLGKKFTRQIIVL